MGASDTAMSEAEWLTARDLRATRGGSLRSAQYFIRRAARDGLRTSERPSRRGKPTLLLHRGDYLSLLGGLAPTP